MPPASPPLGVLWDWPRSLNEESRGLRFRPTRGPVCKERHPARLRFSGSVGSSRGMCFALVLSSLRSSASSIQLCAGQMWPANGHRAAAPREGTWRWLCGQGSACRTHLSACPLLGWSIARPSGQVGALAPPPARCPLRQTPGLRLPCPRPGAQGDPLRVSCALTLVTTSGQGPGADGL